MARLEQIPQYTVKPFSVQEAVGGAVGIRGQQLKQEALTGQIAGQEAELARFTEESNLRSLVGGAQQYLSLPTEQHKEIFLQDRVQEILERGGDPRDTVEMLGMTPEQREATATQVVEIGKQQGFLVADPRVLAKKNLIVKKVMVGDEEHQIGYDPVTGKQVVDLGKTAKDVPLVSIGMDVDEFEKAEAKAAVKEKEGYREFITQNTQQHKQILQMKNLMKNIPKDSILTGTGILAPTIKQGAKLFEKITGFKVAGLAAAEQVDALNNALAMGSREPGSGVFTDKDFEVYSNIQAGLGDTREAFDSKIKLKLASIKYDNDFFKFKSKYIRDKRTTQGLDEATEQWKQEHPYEEVLSVIVEGKDVSTTPQPYKEALESFGKRASEMSIDELYEAAGLKR